MSSTKDKNIEVMATKPMDRDGKVTVFEKVRFCSTFFIQKRHLYCHPHAYYNEHLDKHWGSKLERAQLLTEEQADKLMESLPHERT